MAHLHAPRQARVPEPSNQRRANHGAVQRAQQEDGAAAHGHSPASRLGALPSGTREQVLLSLQRQQGNQHVQGMLNAFHGASAPAIQAQAVPLGEEEEEAVQAQAEEAGLQMEGEEEEELQMAANEEEELQMVAEEDEELQMEAEEEEELQMAAEEEEELQMVAEAGQLRRYARPSMSQGQTVTERINRQRAQGSALDTGTQQRFNASFGQSFAQVRIHNDSQADHLARELGARAFTTGNDIFFRSGAYAPGTTEGDHLLAHELTHVVQQGSGRVPPGHQSAGGRDTGDVFEQEAEQTANAMVSAPQPGASGAPAVQRHRDDSHGQG